MRIPIAIRGGFEKKKLPSRSESSENIQLNKLEFVDYIGVPTSIKLPSKS